MKTSRFASLLLPLLALASLFLAYRDCYALADLSISNSDIVFTPVAPEPGEPVTISAIVRNSGNDYFITPSFSRHNVSDGQGSDFVSVYNSVSPGQYFVASSNLYLGKVSLFLRNAGDISDAITVEIRRNKGLGLGPSNIASDSIATRTIVSTFTAFGWQDFTFATAPFLSSGATYWICVSNPLTNKDEAYQWWMDTGTALNMVRASPDQGTNWGILSGGNYTAYYQAYRTTDTIVECYNGDPYDGGQLVGISTLHTPLPQGGSYTAAFSTTTPSNATAFYITIDRPGHIAENLENNNSAFKTITPVATAPQISGTVSPQENAIGISATAPVTVTFSEDMDQAATLSALSVVMIRDNSGSSAASLINGSTHYLDKTLTFTAAWQKGCTYRVILSTAAHDLYGSPLAEAKTWSFTTVMDYSSPNIFTDGSGRVTLPAGAIDGDYYLVIDTNSVAEQALGSKVVQANAKIEKIRGRFFSPVADSMRRITLYRGTWPGTQHSGTLSKNVSITLPYDDGSVNGLTLGLYRLDEDNNLWVKVPNAVINTDTKEVTAQVGHFSVYALLGGSDTDLSAAYAYPVPWKPSAGRTETGTLAGGITFTGLGSEAAIRIYTLSGELVKVLNYSYTGGAEQQNWDGTNTNNEPVASGVYLYYIQNAKEHTSGKLIIVR